MTELVLAINAEELKHRGMNPTGLVDIDLSSLDQQNYAFLPRSFADNKSEAAVTLGKMFPQILGYFQIVNHEGRILCYQRKGKEKGLLGKWSLGVGGHVSQEDLYESMDETYETFPDITDIIYRGAFRELNEELGINPEHTDELESSENFAENADKLLYSHADVTSSVHVGLPMKVQLTEYLFDMIKLDKSEFLNYQWLLPSELNDGREWETWSKLLIEAGI